MTSESELVSFEVLKKASSVQFEVAVAQMQFGEQNTGNWWEYILLGLEYDPNLKQEKDYLKRNDKRKEKTLYQKKEFFFSRKPSKWAPHPINIIAQNSSEKWSLCTDISICNIASIVSWPWRAEPQMVKTLSLLVYDGVDGNGEERGISSYMRALKKLHNWQYNQHYGSKF